MESENLIKANVWLDFVAIQSDSRILKKAKTRSAGSGSGENVLDNNPIDS